MSRIRSLHPGFFTDERLVTTSLEARLLFLGLGIEADDKGVFEWKPVTLKMRIFPVDNVDVAARLDELAAADAVMAYEVDGRKYGAIRNFRRFQRPKLPNDVHPMPLHFRSYVGLTPSTSEVEPRQLDPFPKKGEKSFQMEEIRVKGGDKRESKKKKKTLGAFAPQERDFFAEFWLAYPRREGSNPKKPAQTAFLRIVAKGADPEALINAAKQLARDHPTPTRFIPQAVTFLNQERHADLNPVITGQEFCPAEWIATKYLVARFRAERQTDPPTAIHGGKAGFMLPAEWVAIARQRQDENGARVEN